MLTASGSPLVGGHLPDTPMALKPTLRVKVLRAFLLRLDRKEIGAELTIDRALAKELAASNKVEILPDAPAPAEAPPAPDKPKRAKE